jgi:NDP-sugar pyrophosphorylase family protein
MVFVDYGLLVLSRSLIEEHVAPDVEADLSKLLETLSADGNLAGYEATERFFEIGSPKDSTRSNENCARVRAIPTEPGVDDR